jgi:hypothetical protein
MNDAATRALVAEAVSLDRQIAEWQQRLKDLKGDLIERACKRPESDRIATEGGGWTWTAEGNDGCVCQVIMPGPKLRTTFDPKVKAHEKILARFGDAVKSLFTKRMVYDAVENFRAAVENDFPPAQAAKLIAACETQSEARVAFQTADRTAVK